MEFNEKLQQLRKQKGLTQEELAEKLYVSRAAVSKWESGRGYPSIDSLKAIAGYFSVSLDVLLSGEEVLNIAEETCAQTERQFRDLVFALADCSFFLFSFFPIFAERVEGIVSAVSLWQLYGVESYLRIVYWAVTLGMALWGILIFALQRCNRDIWLRLKYPVSFLVSGIGMLLFIISLQPYAAVLLLLLLIVKGLFVLKRHDTKGITVVTGRFL